MVGFSSISLDCLIHLGSCLAWHEILSVCFSGLQRDHPENPYEKYLGGTRLCTWYKRDRFHDRRPLDKAQWPVQDPGVRADAQCDIVHGSKNLFQRAILYRHKKNNWGREDRRPRPKKTMCKFCSDFHWYLWIDQFVWYKNMLLCFSGLPRGHQENPYEKD